MGGFSTADFMNFVFRAQRDATYVATPFQAKTFDMVVQRQSEVQAKKAFDAHLKSIDARAKALEANNPKRKVVEDLIANDPAAPKNLDVEHMTDMIMQASAETGVDSLVIASIAQRETHFTQNVPTRNGSGVMQLTSITIKDMFLRPKYYDKSLLPIIEKYRTPANLIKAMRKDPALNIKLGALCYKAKLKLAKGNEKKALEYYNGSSLKKTYAQAVMKNINNVRQSVSFGTIA